MNTIGVTIPGCADNSGLRESVFGESVSKKILVIEDSKICWKIFQRFLDKELPSDVTVHRATTASEAQGFVNNNHYSLIISDFNLADGSRGDEFVVSLRSNKENINFAVPIIAYTSEIGSLDQFKNYSKLFEGYLSKKLDGKALKKVLVKYHFVPLKMKGMPSETEGGRAAL